MEETLYWHSVLEVEFLFFSFFILSTFEYKDTGLYYVCLITLWPT